ncbi:MAG: hypothetical protein AB1714_05470 [Acidobacteriota bacterium]
MRKASLVGLVSTLLFLVMWRIGYAYRFWSYRPLWVFVQTTHIWAGVLGTICILLSMSYSLGRRKWLPWGSARFWLSLHTVLGLAGPVLIEIHGYGKSYGIAGLAGILMWIVSLSGFVGLYLRRGLKRTVEERQERRRQLESEIETLSLRLAERHVSTMEVHELIEEACARTSLDRHEKQIAGAALSKKPSAIFSLLKDYLSYLVVIRRLKDRLSAAYKMERRLAEMQRHHYRLLLEIERASRTTQMADELFSLWRLVHFPLTITFFIAAGLHAWAVWRF